MKKHILSFLFITTLLTAYAEGSNGSLNNNSNNNNNSNSTSASDTSGTKSDPVGGAADTVKSSLTSELARRIWDVNDSLMFIPAYDVYCKWDTSMIHHHAGDVMITDTVTIVLEGETSCYAHPYMGSVTSNFGYRRTRMHYGVDINLETGDTVVAAFDGKVRIAKMNRSYGNLVVIRHSNGLETYYAHLSKLLVAPDQDVKAGEVIGLGGNTGRSYGSHLHFEVRYKGRPIDPNELIDFTDKRLVADTFNITQKNFDDLGVVKKTSSKYQKVPYAKNYKPGTKKPAAKTKYHVVKKGDTLYGIAKRYGTTPKSIAQKNGISLKATLAVGKKLKI